MNKKNFTRFTLAYDGRSYLGWQDNGLGPTIESTLQAALSQILQEPTRLLAASRTDAGVHASSQIVTATIFPRYSLSRLHSSLNSLLPPDIRILSLQQTPPFHPSLDALSKTYTYSLTLDPIQSPHQRHTHWHTGPLDLDAMNAAVPHLLGTHDFTAFTNACKDPQDPIRTLHSITIGPTLTFTGTSFLYRMVRNLTGTLVQIGRRQLDPTNLPTILASKKRSNAGLCAPPHGLSLTAITYP